MLDIVRMNGGNLTNSILNMGKLTHCITSLDIVNISEVLTFMSRINFILSLKSFTTLGPGLHMSLPSLADDSFYFVSQILNFFMFFFFQRDIPRDVLVEEIRKEIEKL